jgi:hypothetical protein
MGRGHGGVAMGAGARDSTFEMQVVDVWRVRTSDGVDPQVVPWSGDGALLGMCERAGVGRKRGGSIRKEEL